MKLRVRFLQLPVRFEAAALAAEVAALPSAAWRPHPQGYPGNDALPLITTGGDPSSDAREGAMGPTPWLTACPSLMQVMDALGATWGRSRLMRLSGDAEVTPHVDTDYYWRDHMRVHVPIVTWPTVRFRCGDEEVNMGPGEAWIFDTWSLHSVKNDATRARIHLVADTVGGGGLLDLIEQAQPPRSRPVGWAPRLHVLAPGAAPPRLAYESRNAPVVMTPWEMRDHLSFLMSEVAAPGPQAAAVGQALNRLRTLWHALWARSGDAEEARAEYRAILDAARTQVRRLGADQIALKNGMALGRCLTALIFESALAGAERAMDAETRAAPGLDPPSSPARPVRKSEGVDPDFAAPIFIISPPRSGSTLLFETLAQVRDLFTIGSEAHRLMEAVPALRPSARDWSSNRLTPADVDAGSTAELRRRFREALRDRAGAAPPPGPVRLLEKTPKNALRVSYLATAFPEARFVWLWRDPRPTLASMMEGWRSGEFRTYPHLPGWTGLDWSFLLTPGWRELIGAPLNAIVAAQWAQTTRIALDDLSALPRERWLGLAYDDLVRAPGPTVTRLCEALGLVWDRPAPTALALSRFTLSAPAPDKWRTEEDAIMSVWPKIEAEAVRAEAALKSARPLSAPIL
ncbi:MAG: sulfotransferase [Alphaproteobacteria bacterium]|nr:sulfotransferase [Alphaproteobacteria bacterium]